MNNFQFGLITRAARNMEATVDSYESDLEALQAQIAQLTLALAVEQANVAGLIEERDQMRKQNPNMQLLKNTSVKFQDGTPKTFARLVFEGAFDKKAKALGIPNPAQYRNN